ncbi:MAG: glycosyltransferase [Alphaproteobacteria bacterium]|nr:glycosyltransferase [Alphaproteobacteria bacterium]
MSWLIPVRDGGPWLQAAVDSAAAQLGPADELLVVDDGSQDGAAQALRPHPGLRRLYQPASGIVAALERGRAEARGRFLARLDADDLALPGRIEAQVAALEADPRLGAVGGRAEIFAAGEVPEGMRRYVEGLNALTDLHARLLIESPLFHPSVTLRAEAVAEVGGYAQGDFPEDYALWLDLAAAGWRLARLDRPVLALRDHPHRLTRTDPRYSREAFRDARQRYLDATCLREPRRVGIWGAGRTARAWCDRLQARGHLVALVVDQRGRGRLRGLPVLPPEALRDAELDLLLFAVNIPEAREAARAWLTEHRPDWREGERWWAIA